MKNWNYHKNIFPTLVWYYYICHREVWLMSRQLNPSQSNPFIEIGRLISKESYQKERKEIHLENMIIDVLRTKENKIIVGEVKKSSRFEKAATMQLAYYLYRLKLLGLDAQGELLFPKEKKNLTVTLTPELEEELTSALEKINSILEMERPPEPKKIKFCSKCGYQEFCWS